MKKIIAKALAVVLTLSVGMVYAPRNLKVDVVSAATTGTETPTKPSTTTPTKTTTPAPVVSAGSQIYSVVKGDMLWKIAKKFSLTLDQLLALNPQIKNRNLIKVGQKIVVGKKAETVVTAPTTPTTPVVAKKLFHGFGEAANYRTGHTSLNITTASVVFDQDGKIVNLKWDVQEISPTLFPGWADEKKLSADELAAFKAAINDQWKTKLEEKDEYGMKASAISGKEWWEQISFYESFFKGMTVAQVEEWANKYTDANKRPWKLAYLDNAKLKDADKEAIKKATANFTAAEKDMLVDVTTSATMSIQDDHSHFITALKEAYEARTEIK